MKTNERRYGNRCRAVVPGVWLGLLIAACGGATKGLPQLGSESHFLAECTGSCSGGLECIAGICTRPCLTSQASCSDLASGARCTNQSVEPGEVAVCDVACLGAGDCAMLGGGYECRAGYCREPLASGQGGSGSSGQGGSSPGAQGGSGGSSTACQPVGRYEVGKEGGYLPCCAGLNEISTLSLVTSSGALACEQLPLNTYACIEGSCGDGRCEEPETACGCARDCADAPGPARDALCSGYLDQSPPPVVHQVSIVNGSGRTLYIEPVGGCGESLFGLERDGQAVNITGFNCGTGSCQTLLASGWQEPLDCASTDCAPKALTPIAPGQTLTQISALEWRTQEVPQACISGAPATLVSCATRVIPSRGTYTLSVRTYLVPDCLPSGCTPTVQTVEGNYFFEDQTIVLLD